MYPPQPLIKVPKAGDIIPLMQEIVAAYDIVIDRIVRTIDTNNATFKNIVQPWADTGNAMQGDLCMIANLQYCSPSLETQDAKEVAQPELEQESRYLLEERMKEYERCGYGKLSEDGIQEFLQGRLKIAELCTQFNQNIQQENSGLWFTADELEGVPQDQLAKWKSEETSPGQIKRFVPFADGGAQTILRYAQSSSTRRRMHIENEQKLTVNGPIFEEIIRRRYAQAQKLALPNYAALRAPVRAVKSAEWIENLLESISDCLAALAQKEVGKLQEIRTEDRKARGVFQEGDENTFPSWEQLYYDNLLRRALSVDEEKVSEYFPVEYVMSAMLRLFMSFQGLRFDRIPENELGQEAKWHESVEIFAVWNGPTEQAEFVGWLYLDLIWREHKYRGNQNVNVECGYVKPDGSRKYPSTVLSCGLTTPAPGTCKSLKHREVLTLFHELGHAIHDLLSRTKFVNFHGSNRLPVDMGEMPSMFLENFVWDQDVLFELSRHYTTLSPDYLAKWRIEHPGEADPPETIPEHLVKALQQSQYVNEGLYRSHQLSVSLFDMKIHSVRSAEDLDALDIRSLWYDLREDVEKKNFDDIKSKGSECATFGHLVSGYDVGYYGYLACSASAQDIWRSKFASSPRDTKVWDRYRRMILEYGGAHPDKLQMLEDFLGREPDIDALVKSLEP